MKSIENAISRFCIVDLKGLRIKHKIRTNNRAGKLNWWFVIHGDESTLCELENSWDALQTQTSWVLETCTKSAADNVSSNETSNQAANTAPKFHSAQEDPVLLGSNPSWILTFLFSFTSCAQSSVHSIFKLCQHYNCIFSLTSAHL